MDEFAREWTYRTPLVTKTYAKGHSEVLPAVVRKAAEADGALVEHDPDAGGEADAKPMRRRKKADE